MTVHILAGCGSFMAGLATIAKQSGQDVIAYDQQYQAPMRDQLAQAEITMRKGYEHPVPPEQDTIVVGNAISRGNPMLEALLTERRAYFSGPEWLGQHVLADKKTIAVSGTHGKTTTTSLFAWVLTYLNEDPGFLIGGIANNLGASARYGKGDWFVIEADEYDTCFADKRPKFFHYPASLLIINNLEFDHADIYRDLEEIKKQFRYYLRTFAPGTKVVFSQEDSAVAALVEEAHWCDPCPISKASQQAAWTIHAQCADWSAFKIIDGEGCAHLVKWSLIGRHNAENALAVMRGAVALGLDVQSVVAAICCFTGVRKRMQKIGMSASGQEVWDDYAHHPTALSKVITACRSYFKEGRLVIVLQLSNYTQRQGLMWQALVAASAACDLVILVDQGDQFPYQDFQAAHTKPVEIITRTTTPEALRCFLQPGDKIITCSSRDCGFIHEKILEESDILAVEQSA